MYEITFKGKEEYLAWAAKWKADYKQLSSDIRACKLSRKLQASNPQKASRNAKGEFEWVREREFDDREKAINAQAAAAYDRWKPALDYVRSKLGGWPDLSLLATWMIAQRHESKKEAQRQYLAERETKAAA